MIFIRGIFLKRKGIFCFGPNPARSRQIISFLTNGISFPSTAASAIAGDRGIREILCPLLQVYPPYIYTPPLDPFPSFPLAETLCLARHFSPESETPAAAIDALEPASDLPETRSHHHRDPLPRLHLPNNSPEPQNHRIAIVVDHRRHPPPRARRRPPPTISSDSTTTVGLVVACYSAPTTPSSSPMTGAPPPPTSAPPPPTTTSPETPPPL